MMKLHVFKYQGAGNDFVILDNRELRLPSDRFPALARALCAFHTGVGADGLMVVVPPERGGDYGMLFFNSDGSAGEMCGNGARCICRYGHDRGLAGDTQRVETTAGLVVGKRIDETRYQVRLNDPTLVDLHREVTAGGAAYDCAYLELGSPALPHAVVRLDGWDDWDRDRLRALGRELRFHAAFPKGANVSFVRFLSPGRVKAVTFERGVEDFTLACGTGCGSITAALCLLGLVESNALTVEMPGGTLEVSLTRDGDRARGILLTGPTRLVFEAELSEEILDECGV